MTISGVSQFENFDNYNKNQIAPQNFDNSDVSLFDINTSKPNHKDNLTDLINSFSEARSKQSGKSDFYKKSPLTDLRKIRLSRRKKKAAKQNFVEKNVNSKGVKPLAKKIVEKADSYLGYNENDRSSDVFFRNGEDSRTTPWCAAYVSTVLEEAGADLEGLGWRRNSVPGITDWGQERGIFQSGADSNFENVTPGDVVIWEKPEEDLFHVGIVTKVYSDGTFDSDEGNTVIRGKNGNPDIPDVTAKKYAKSISNATGFLRMTA